MTSPSVFSSFRNARLDDPQGRYWLKAALKTVNAPHPIETTLEEFVNHLVQIVYSDNFDLNAALKVASFIEEVPSRTIANIVSRTVFSYRELNDAQYKIRHVFGNDLTRTANGEWIEEMAGFEMARASA